MITSAQCRAARGLLDWTQQELADRAGVGIVTVRQVEAGLTEPRRATLEVMKRALETAGVEFIDENSSGPGVRLRKPQRKKGKRSRT
jgi:transcriptional regulator with XRE-family HTH domain